MNMWADGIEAKRNALLAKYPERTFGKVKVERAVRFIQGKTGDGPYEWREQIRDVEDAGWNLYMDHQCDEFQIGRVDDARQLIADLQAAIDYCLHFEDVKK